VQLQETRDAIVRLLLKRTGAEGLRLKDIADELHLSNAAVLAHLGILQSQGLVETRHEGSLGRGSRYWPKPAFQGLWVDPSAKRLSEWSAKAPVDWRFPLVSRVRDEKAQEFLLKWFDLLQFKGKLPKMRSKHHKEVFPPALVQIVVYGSCARGDANARSDLDILIFTDAPRRAAQELADLAHEASLGVGRSPDVRIIGPKEWTAAGAAFKENIRAEGLTVFSNDPNAPFLEDSAGGAA
jgi:predicted nucleotidyltransferase